MNPDPTQHQRIQEEAATWLAKLNSGEVTFEEREQFSRWVGQSQENRDAYFALRKRWQHLNDALDHAPLPKPRYSKYSGLALVASLLLVVSLFTLRNDIQNAALADYTTAVGEQKLLTLADGSTVVMNTDTALAVAYSQGERRIRLLQGEADFIVAHDRSRPFVVSSKNRTVTALGTEFSVASWEDDFTVTVFASAVRIAQDQEIVADRLQQGQQLVLDGAGMPRINQHANLQEALAWREGKLVFTAKPLGDVIKEINRYRPGKLILLSPTAASKPVSGIFDRQQLDNLISVMAGEMNLKLVNRTGYWVAMY